MRKFVIAIAAVVAISGLFAQPSVADSLGSASTISGLPADALESAMDLQNSLVADSGVASDGKAQTDVTIMSSAPPLTALEVIAVASEQYPYWDPVWNPDRMVTQGDHGGSWMYVITDEIGYGNNPIAQMNGSNLVQLDYEPIVENGIIIGYRRLWDASGHSSGQFYYENTSINSPWNTMSDWVYIQ